MGTDSRAGVRRHPTGGLARPTGSMHEFPVERMAARITHWRAERLIRVGYDDSLYREPLLLWTQSSFVQPQMMIHDRTIYDPSTHHYTVDRYLDDVNGRYGGIDSVLVWHTYSNIGIDSRNQYDMLRDLPGGPRP